MAVRHGNHCVDHSLHNAKEAGDEALMLAESRDVLVARDRIAGAVTIAATGKYDVILMDDGLQHPYIARIFQLEYLMEMLALEMVGSYPQVRSRWFQ